MTALRILLRQFNSPLIYLLAFAGVISFFLASAVDAAAIGIILVINALLGFIQEYRGEKFVEKLAGLIKKTATVRRNNEEIEILQKEVVAGDTLILEEGDIICADGTVTKELRATVNESFLSGESEDKNKNLGEKVFAGTTVTGGLLEISVTAVGVDSRLGEIAQTGGKIRKKSKYEENIWQLSQFLMKVTLGVLFLIFVVNLIIHGFTGSNLISLLLFSLALAIGIVPEALPVVSTLTLSVGALKLSQKSVVVKRLSAVEDLGNIEILCLDKTGTLTKNSLIVKEIISKNSERFLELVSFCLEKKGIIDKAIQEKISSGILERRQGKLLAFLPFDPKKRRRWTLIEENNEKYLLVFGAAEEITKNKEISLWEEKGFRVLALGMKKVTKDFSLEKDFDDQNLDCLGMLTLFDPLRETARETVSLAKKLGVKIKIITGDSLGVAKFVAQEAGLVESDQQCFSGTDLDNLEEEKFAQVCETGVVFARVTPEQKYKIIETLKKKFVVGFEGDGINDALALKAASVGIAVAGAAEVAQEAADIILLRADLRVVIEGIEDGRKIFFNIDKYIKHTLVSNWGNFLAVAILSFFTVELPLLPLQILLTSLFSDLPLLAVATDNVDRADLRQPAKYNLRELISLPLFLGLVTMMINLVFFMVYHSLPLPEFRTLWFVLITVMDLVVVFSVRRTSWFFLGAKPSLTLFLAILITIVAGLFLPFSPLAKSFYLVKINGSLLTIVITITAGYLFLLDILKMIYYKFARNNVSC